MILDTCALLWLASGDKKLSRSALKKMNEASAVYVSAISGFEIAIKVAKGKLKLVKPSADDLKAREKALNEVVLARWAKRCGDACAAKWNQLVGKKYSLTAKAN